MKLGPGHDLIFALQATEVINQKSAELRLEICMVHYGVFLFSELGSPQSSLVIWQLTYRCISEVQHQQKEMQYLNNLKRHVPQQLQGTQGSAPPFVRSPSPPGGRAMRSQQIGTPIQAPPIEATGQPGYASPMVPPAGLTSFMPQAGAMTPMSPMTPMAGALTPMAGGAATPMAGGARTTFAYPVRTDSPMAYQAHRSLSPMVARPVVTAVTAVTGAPITAATPMRYGAFVQAQPMPINPLILRRDVARPLAPQVPVAFKVAPPMAAAQAAGTPRKAAGSAALPERFAAPSRHHGARASRSTRKQVSGAETTCDTSKLLDGVSLLAEILKPSLRHKHITAYLHDVFLSRFPSEFCGPSAITDAGDPRVLPGAMQTRRSLVLVALALHATSHVGGLFTYWASRPNSSARLVGRRARGGDDNLAKEVQEILDELRLDEPYAEPPSHPGIPSQVPPIPKAPSVAAGAGYMSARSAPSLRDQLKAQERRKQVLLEEQRLHDLELQQLREEQAAQAAQERHWSARPPVPENLAWVAP
eukprot:s2441_g5.t1